MALSHVWTEHVADIITCII